MIYFRRTIGLDKDKKPIFKIEDTKGVGVIDKKVLEYVKNLVIPPMYRDVKIFMEASPKILFEGFDAKDRLQQIYSPAHKKAASKKKFCDLRDFGKVLPKLENDVRTHVSSKAVTKDKIISLIISIITLCGFRLGNLKYEKLYNSFGISNIHKKHIKLNKKGATIEFVGKKSVLNTCDVSDKKLIDQISDLIKDKKPNDYVFEYVDDKNKLVVITAIEINKWLKSYHQSITSKMFRTWYTNVMFIEYTRNDLEPSKKTTNQRKKVIVEAMKAISIEINNTPAILKKEYMHGSLIELYLEKPKVYTKYFHGCDKPQSCFINFLDDWCK
jgi:DNA topoisomerase-1